MEVIQSMNENDLSAWFVAKPSLKKHGKTFAENFLKPAAIEAVYNECGRILGDQPTAKITDIVGAAIQTAESVWQDLVAESLAFDCNKGCSVLPPNRNGHRTRGAVRSESYRKHV